MAEKTKGFKDARPTISVAGKDDPTLGLGLLSLMIVENTNGLYRCEATFNNWGSIDHSIGFLYFDRRTLEFGKSFKVKLGSDMLFNGRILGLEAHYPEGRSPELAILAEDRFQDLRMTRRTRTFTNVGDADVLRRIASEHGLIAVVDITGPTHKVLAQVNQSNLAFLRERVRTIDAELWMEDSTLHAQLRTKRNHGSFKMAYGNELREFSVLADLAMQCTSVTVNGWDVSSKVGLRYETTDSIIAGELKGDTGGASILAQTFGQRKEALAHTVPLTSQEAQAEAETFFKMSARRFVTGRGIADADSQLRVGSYVDLQGLGALFSGKYYLSEVKHIFDGTCGIRTEFTAERPGLGRI
jgi:phage protein D